MKEKNLTYWCNYEQVAMTWAAHLLKESLALLTMLWHIVMVIIKLLLSKMTLN